MSVKLSKISNAERAKLCKQYFYTGFALLPFVWITNVVWFYKYAFSNEDFEEKTNMKFYVKSSFFASIVWIIILTMWITYYQCIRAQGVAWADYLTAIFPLGHV